MNLKQAKKIRSYVRSMYDKNDVTQYVDGRQNVTQAFTGKYDIETGKPVIEDFVYTGTRTVGRDCFRGLYRAVKKSVRSMKGMKHVS